MPLTIRAPSPDTIIYDVGGTYDPDLNLFDHHQKDAPTREDGSPYSAFGLVWARYGRDYLLEIGVDPELADGVHASVDRSLVLGIDLLDNGALDPSGLGPAAGLTLPSLIHDLHPAYDAPEGAEQAWFEVAVLELARCAPFNGAIREAGADHLLFVVHPRKTDWVVSCVSLEAGSYARRRDLPEAWAGLEGEALAEVTGVPDAVFCHRARFLAVAGSREGGYEAGGARSRAGARSGPRAGLMRLLAWHGTNQAFDRFDPGQMGLANPNDASRAALFLAMRADIAWAYAESAARKLVPDQAAHEARVAALLEGAERASRRGDHDLSERLYLKAEELETRALQAEPAGARVLLCEVVLENPLEVGGSSRAVVRDLGAVLRAAREAGHDGVIIRVISDTPAGAVEPDDHVAVFTPETVRILEIRPEVEDEPEPVF